MVEVSYDGINRLIRKVDRIMNNLDRITNDLAKLGTDLSGISTGIGGLKQQIADLQAQIAAGTPATEAQLGAVADQLDGLEQTANQLASALAPPPSEPNA